MSSSGGGSEVSKEDQNNINAFSRLNTRKQELLNEIKGKKSYIDELEDASNELILADDDEDLRLLVGESFIHTNTEQVEEKIQKDKEAAQGDLNKQNEALKLVEKQMSDLKEQLYARFGNKINLEA